jgi:glycosyltransferase involved in cell wall biosynthesis
MKTSKFSVVITSYGVGRRIERAVDSVLSQTCIGPELVIVDDASHDTETIESLKKLEGKVGIERFAERRGVAAARNRGLELTSKPYVVCLDGDDWIEDQYLELAQEIFDSQPKIGIVSAWVTFHGEQHGEWKPRAFSPEDLLASNRLHSATAFRRLASEEVGYYIKELQGYEDWEHWISITERGWENHIIPEFLLHYDRRSDGLGRTANHHARSIVEKIVAKHEDIYRQYLGQVLAIKHDGALALEKEIRAAWRQGENTGKELQRVWGIVGELGKKLEKQGADIGELMDELRESRKRVQDLEENAHSPPVDD